MARYDESKAQAIHERICALAGSWEADIKAMSAKCILAEPENADDLAGDLDGFISGCQSDLVDALGELAALLIPDYPDEEPDDDAERGLRAELEGDL